jgi:hypothetical protein
MVSGEEFRRMALSMPGATEGSHMGHPDFRVEGRIFATLFWTVDGDERGMVKLSPEEQSRFVERSPAAFTRIRGAWGRQGCTEVVLEEATRPAILRAIQAAYRLRSEAGPHRRREEGQSKRRRS